ncbi:hypothetical protein ACLKA6_009944 [Drosophila palustris]
MVKAVSRGSGSTGSGSTTIGTTPRQYNKRQIWRLRDFLTTGAWLNELRVAIRWMWQCRNAIASACPMFIWFLLRMGSNLKQSVNVAVA